MTEDDLATWTAIRGLVQYDCPPGQWRNQALAPLNKIEAELSQLRRERDEATQSVERARGQHRANRRRAHCPLACHEGCPSRYVRRARSHCAAVVRGRRVDQDRRLEEAMTDEELAELEARVLRGDYQPRLALIAALREARGKWAATESCLVNTIIERDSAYQSLKQVDDELEWFRSSLDEVCHIADQLSNYVSLGNPYAHVADRRARIELLRKVGALKAGGKT